MRDGVQYLGEFSSSLAKGTIKLPIVPGEDLVDGMQGQESCNYFIADVSYLGQATFHPFFVAEWLTVYSNKIVAEEWFVEYVRKFLRGVRTRVERFVLEPGSSL